MIVATAGHVDHGKTSLVRALTGVDTDRLPEEKRRGLSIDLGFAYLPVADGLPIAFVDVPGHERYVRNMAAGIQAIDLALLVVAADDGPMPQTLEHLSILGHRGVKRMVAILTKVDRVPEARRVEAAQEVARLLERGPYAGSPVVEFSAATGHGVSDLRGLLVERSRQVGPRMEDNRPFRLNVDRAFVLEGLGVVVTGTVLTGCVRVGDSLTTLPGQLRTRVRSLRVHGRDAPASHAGQRCALVLHGISHDQIERGDVLAGGDLLPLSRLVDVMVRLEPGTPAVSKRRGVEVLVGTRNAQAQLAWLEEREGSERLARLAFSQEASMWHGDRLLLRDAGGASLMGGAEVIDPMAPERGSRKPQRLALLRQLQGAGAGEALDILLATPHGLVDRDRLARSWHLTDAAMETLLAARDVCRFGTRARRIAPRACLQLLADSIDGMLAGHHASHPDEVGPSLFAIRDRFAGPFGLEMLTAVLEACVRDGRILRNGGTYRQPGHQPAFSAPDEALWARFAPLLADAPGKTPPRVHELSQALGIEPKAVEDFLMRATLAGRVLRIARNRFFMPESFERMADHARQLHAASPDSGFTAAQFRDASGLGRNLSIEVLEYLDEAGYTRRSAGRRRCVQHQLEEKRTPVGRPDFKPGERRLTPLAGSTPASSATMPRAV